MIYKPLFIDFPDVKETIDMQKSTLMLGDSLLIIPFGFGLRKKKTYIPKANWYDFYSGVQQTDGKADGSYKKISNNENEPIVMY